MKFRRQHPIGRYIVDFYCAAAKLVVELDGKSHDEKQDADAVREESLRSKGYDILRFTNEQVLWYGDKTVDCIGQRAANLIAGSRIT